ncbi:hypothetical protein XENORESO_015509 [Xenotaenia resolanae]|uniref:Uncharacterized protein n=1 Tax=Xenotaenia resolanae TaxID=208358 RepID=A0ABV0WLR0_9TELE
MQKIQTLSPQEIFTDYLLSWLHSGFKSPLATCERTWLTLHSAPLQDHPPGATSTSSASKRELPGPFTYPTRSWSFPSSHFSSPPGGSPNHPLGEFQFLQQSKIFHNKLVKTFPVFLSVFLHVGQSSKKNDETF